MRLVESRAGSAGHLPVIRTTTRYRRRRKYHQALKTYARCTLSSSKKPQAQRCKSRNLGKTFLPRSHNYIVLPHVNIPLLIQVRSRLKLARTSSSFSRKASEVRRAVLQATRPSPGCAPRACDKRQRVGAKGGLRAPLAEVRQSQGEGTVVLLLLLLLRLLLLLLRLRPRPRLRSYAKNGPDRDKQCCDLLSDSSMV